MGRSQTVRKDCGTAEVDEILERLAEGDRSAKNELWVAVYEDLHRRAERMLSGRRASLRPTEMIQEVFLKFEAQRKTPVNRRHFRAVAAQLMYRVLLDYFRRQGRRNRAFVTLRGDGPPGRPFDVDALALRRSIEGLERDDPTAAKVVIYRFFGELTMREIGVELELSERQVYRLWEYARARILSELGA